VIAAPDGPTPNDFGLLANESQNAPLLTSAVSTQGRLRVTGLFDGPDPESVVIEFYANLVPVPGGDPSGRGEGAIFLDSARPDEQGEFNALLEPVPAGTIISATATDSDGNTSEFSVNIVVSSLP
jgi:titin